MRPEEKRTGRPAAPANEAAPTSPAASAAVPLAPAAAPFTLIGAGSQSGGVPDGADAGVCGIGGECY